MIAARLAEVRARIDAACRACGREASDVELVAVSKRHEASAIREAFEAGQRVFGESYAQELDNKARELSDLDLQWRFIGHLQSNKSRVVAQHAHAVDSVDTVKLVDRLSKARLTAGKPPLEVLLQLDLAAEATKSGAGEDTLVSLVAAARAAPCVRLMGLMTLPPVDPAVAARCFERLAELARVHELRTLSMGMSGDLELAIAHGSTQVRVGTAIFGPRPS